MSFTIFSKEFSGIIQLQGVAGASSIYTSSGETYVEGMIILSFRTNGDIFLSKASLILRNKISIIKENGNYYVDSIVGFSLFSFVIPIALSKNDISPVLYISEIGITKATILEISFEKIALSIVGPIHNPDTFNHSFYYSNSNAPLALSKIPSPVSGRLGFYLVSSFGENQVQIGAPGAAVTLDDFKSVSLTIAANTTFRYSLTQFSLIIQSTVEGNHFFQFNSETGWELDLNPGSDIFSFLEIKELICTDGWLSSSAFFSPEVTISKKHTNVPHLLQRTKILSHVDRLVFHYPMEISEGAKQKAQLTFNQKTFIDVPQVVYSSDLTEEVSLNNQHYGIRLRGMQNDKTVPVKLDANLAVIRLDEASGKMHLYAGNLIKVQGKEKLASLVLPKKNIIRTHKREVKIPCLPALLVVEANPGRSSFEINTETSEFFILSPLLETSPYAPGNLIGADKALYGTLTWLNTQDKIAFTITNDAIKPQNSDWLNNFKINPIARQFNILNSQRTDIQYDPDESAAVFGLGTEVTTTVITTRRVDEAEKEKLVYLAYAGIIGFSAAWIGGGLICDTANPGEIYTCLQRKGKEYINIKFDTRQEDPAKVKEWLKNENVNELAIVYYDNNPKIKKFIDENIKADEPTDEKPTSIAFWPIMGFIGIPLVIKRKNTVARYCFDIVNDNFPNANIICGLGVDQNQKGIIDVANNFGFNPASFDNFATKDFKKLFPYYNQVIKGGQQSTTSGGTDPTDPKFTGIVFRNMPVMVKVPTDKLPKFLDKLIDEINRNLFLEFGWRNDKGLTWIARTPLASAANVIEIVKNSVVKFTISNINMVGQDSRLTNFSLETSIGLFRKGSTSSENYKITVDAIASITFNDKTIDNCVITPKPSSAKPIDVKDIIPGFDYVRFHRFETGGKQLSADIELFPDSQLVEALEIFEKYTRKTDDPATFNPSHVLRTVMVFDLENDSALISIIVNSSTKVFGKWPLTIRAVNIIIGGTNNNRLEVAGDFNLGLDNFVKVGGRVVISHNAMSGWDYDLHLDKIGGRLALSDDLRLEGEVAWGQMFPENTNPPREALKRDELLTKGKDRDFYGVLFLIAPGIFGDSNEMYVKISSKDGVPYWVGGLRIGGDINLGFAKLKDPEVFIAKNSDYRNKIDTIVTNVDAGIKSLRKENNTPRPEWLQEWSFSNKTGFTIVASGYLVYELIGSAVTQKPENDKFTAMLYSSAGILRIEGWLKMFEGIEDVQILFTIDLRKKRILVGFQLPTFYFPNKESASKFTFRPGQLLLGTSFGGPLYFLASFGFPPQTGNSYERDWSKANQVVYEPPTFPIPNMLAGGFKLEFDSAEKFVVYAVAVKAGWKYDVNFGIGKAGLEIAFGGILLIRIDWEKKRLQPLLARNVLAYGNNRQISNGNNHSFEALSPKIRHSIAKNFEIIKHDIETASLTRISILGELFADIIGYAEVGIFGITLAGVYLHAYARMRICGDTDNGITHIGGSFGAEFCVKIGCITYCKSANINVIVIPGTCSAEPLNYQFLPQLN
jgi:hypothetical protein